MAKRKERDKVEASARGMLGMAKSLKANGDREAAIRKLEELLAKYPDSGAAKEASELLKSISR